MRHPEPTSRRFSGAPSIATMRYCPEVPPTLPSLEEMRALLRAGMTRDEFFGMLDDLAARPGGLRFGAPTVSPDLVSIPVEEGDQLLCFITDGRLTYVEYRGGIFLEVEP